MSSSITFDFLPGVPKEHIIERLKKAGGSEIESGKLASPQSSAALAIDAFGPYIEQSQAFPAFPGISAIDWPAEIVDIEYSARFPWAGGRHPWLDAVLKTQTCLIGVESKRFEPFRDKKSVSLSDAYWRDVWGPSMTAYELLRDDLKHGHVTYKYLDATQLVKHAFGLRTDAVTRLELNPVLVYLYVDTIREAPVKVTPQMIKDHAAEIQDFSTRVKGAEVEFLSLSYTEWLRSFPKNCRDHQKALIKKYQL